jgi:plasmid stabilization system protein ParE
MRYRVRLLNQAQRDLDEIIAWLHARSPLGAARWHAAFNVAQSNLARDPLVYGLAPENVLVDESIHQILFKTRRGHTYRALFVIVGDEVRVLHVRGPNQPLLKRLRLSDD